MTGSKVYFSDFHIDVEDSSLNKFERLVRAAGIGKMKIADRFVAIKVHFGEYGNMGYLRPGYAKVVSNLVKENKGMPFVTDCNTLYVGYRRNALDHLDTAAANGYTEQSLGCNIIISDGLKGDDDIDVPINGDLVKNAKIARGIYDADAIITVSHFKCHEMAGFGGAIKNLGMGCASRRGKMEQHSSSKPSVDHDLCRGCKMCIKTCGSDAIVVKDKKATIDQDKCVGCGLCISTCHYDAVSVPYDDSNEGLYTRMTEYAAASIIDKPSFHISVIADVSPFCDCRAASEVPVVPNIGILASFDPVALDAACADLVNAQPIVKGSRADTGEKCKDIFDHVNPGTNWRFILEHAEKMGMGTSKYEIVEVK